MALRRGGSAGFDKATNNNGNAGGVKYINLFRGDQDIDVIQPKKDHSGIILPAFSMELNEKDEAFPTSVAPFGYIVDKQRTNKNGVTQRIKVLEFNDWFMTYQGYLFMNGTGTHCLSCVEYIDADGNRPWQYDPFDLMRMHVYKKRKEGDESLMYLVQSKDRKSGVALEHSSPLVFMNVLAGPTYDKAKDRSVKTRIMVLKQSAAEYMFAELRRPASREVSTVLDPNWPNLKLGDPTNPKRPIQFIGDKFASNGKASSFEFNGIKFSDEDDLTGSDVVHGNPITAEQLRSRYMLGDTDNLFYIPSFEEMVDVIVKYYTKVPYSLIAECCMDSYDGTFPIRKEKKYSTASVETANNVQQAKTAQGLAGKASSTASYLYEEDEDDDIPMGESQVQQRTRRKTFAEESMEDDTVSAGSLSVADDDPTEEIDDNPTFSANQEIPESLKEMLADSTLNPDGLTLEQWGDKIERDGYANLTPNQLRLCVAVNEYFGM